MVIWPPATDQKIPKPLGFDPVCGTEVLVEHALEHSRQTPSKFYETDDDIKQIEADPSKSLLKEKDSAMLSFVVKTVKEHSAVKTEEIEKLKAMGYEKLGFYITKSEKVKNGIRFVPMRLEISNSSD